MINVLRHRAYLFRDLYQNEQVTEYIHQHCATEAKEVIRQADLLLRNTFVFTDRWDMEPCSEPYTISLEDWVTSPNGDPEWVFMLNRHDFLNKLWQAYMFTGNRAYVEKLKFFIFDWIQKNPITQNGTDATRTIDTGIRCMNWTNLLVHLLATDMLSDAEFKMIIDSLHDQHRNMRERYIAKYALSNWGVLQTTAICAGSVWFPELLPDDVAAWAWKELKDQLSLQILGDGSHWEQSAMYHVEVLNTTAKLLALIKMASQINVSLSRQACDAIAADSWTDEEELFAGPGDGYDAISLGWLNDAVRVLSRHVLYTADPAFLQLAQGDSDVSDTRDVMVRAAILLSGSGIYRYAGGNDMDLDSACLMGMFGIQRYEGLLPLKPRILSWNCCDSGNIFIRSDWEKDANFTWLKCGSLGSSHGHVDQTHMTVYHKGKPFLIDSGRYTYLEEDPLRVLLKKAYAHNVCVIDNYSGGEPNGSWSYHRYDEPLKNYFAEAEGASYTEMGFHGALADGTSYLIKRKVLALEDGVWLSVQDVICPGEHQVKEFFHLDPDVSVENDPVRVVVRNENVSLGITPVEDMAFCFGVVSKRYNEKQFAPILIKVHQMKDRLTTNTLLFDAEYKVNPVPVYQARKEEPVSSDVAVAWDIEKPDGSRKTLIVWNRETYRGDKLYTCHGKSVYGKAVVLSWNRDDCHVIRLKT